MNKGLKKLKEKWDEKPVETLAAVSFAVIAAAKLIESVSEAQGRRAYSQQVKVQKYKAGM